MDQGFQCYAEVTMGMLAMLKYLNDIDSGPVVVTRLMHNCCARPIGKDRVGARRSQPTNRSQEDLSTL